LNSTSSIAKDRSEFLIKALHPGLSPQVSLLNSLTESSRAYNQDLFINSLFIEIGGPENSLDEEYRAVSILAQIIAKQL
jgi:stage II sporulation protein P